MRRNLSVVLKLIVIVFATVGTAMSMMAGSDSFMGGTRMLMYFTIQSNIALALICLVGGYYVVLNKPASTLWYVIKFVGTVSITLTGAVFTFVLAPTMGVLAWNPVNTFTHVIVPIAGIADFFVSGVESDIPKRSVFYVIIPPIIYAVYAGIGYLLGWEFAPGINYPYFFLNWGSEAGAFGFSNELPFIGCMWWIIILLLLLLLVGLLYLKILDGLKKRVRR